MFLNKKSRFWVYELAFLLPAKNLRRPNLFFVESVDISFVTITFMKKLMGYYNL